jgi:AGCS family alanine or glycine:cation symporter
MDALNDFLGVLVGFVWGLPLVLLLVGTGLFLTFYLGGAGTIQIKGFFHAIQVVLGKYDEHDEEGDISHFQALTTALSATVGLGNIAGVAIAISVGGPGATFWMVVVGLVGMATKFAECTLGTMYRKVDADGTIRGGAMHYIERGLGKNWRPLGLFFAFACICSSFGSANMFQTNQVATILEDSFQIPPYVTGLVLMIATAVVIIGGIKRIGKMTAILVPVMGGIYVSAALWVIIGNIGQVPGLISQIFYDAFNGSAAVGGFTGVAVSQVIIQGVRRACFSNEAGLGSAPIAHAAASTKEPVREGVVALLEPFIDTVVICTMTALVILISGAWQDASGIEGVELTARAFNSAISGFGTYFVPVAVLLFAYSTLISWSYYGEQATEYMLGKKAIVPYRVVFCLFAFLGAIWSITPVLSFSDIMLGLMVVPNLIAVIMMLPRIKEATVSYFDRLNRGEFDKA